MDTSDPDLGLDAAGVCRHCRTADKVLPNYRPSTDESARQLEALATKVRRAGRGKEYDSVIGLSGGVDSSYAAHLAHRLGLRPLAVHFDNGWNSEIAVGNIERIIQACNFDLQTYVIDWVEFRDLQRAFLMASVIDIELLTDHAILAAMLDLAREHGIRYVLSGQNIATEHGLPPAWIWNKLDWTNIRAIHSVYGTVPLTSFPHRSYAQYILMRLFRRDLEILMPLNLVAFRRDEAAKELADLYDWREYGGKHHESVFTRFYQNYILPTKFGVDKRRVHLSDQIRNGEFTRDEALAVLERPSYEPAELAREREYVLKKLGFSSEEFDRIMAAAPRSHSDFPSDRRWAELVRILYQPIKRLRSGI
jgi:N-acetyl sugar amidotransferase